MFVDEIKIYARAGHGGKGCVAFQREKYRPKGGPSGGNGGRGGDVILEADHDLNNLIGQYYVPRLIAEDGEAGLGKGMDGAAGRPLLRSASGERAVEVDLSEEESAIRGGTAVKGEVVADLTQHGQRWVLCKVGRGGVGNRNFATAR